jgi:hypothetical protein
LWSCGERDGGSRDWVSQVLIIGNVVDDDLLSNVSVEGLLVVRGWEVGVGVWLVQVVDNESGSGINTGGVAGSAVSITDTGWIGRS